MGEQNIPAIFIPFFAGIVFIFLGWYLAAYPESFAFISLDHSILSILFYIGGGIALIIGVGVVVAVRKR